MTYHADSARYDTMQYRNCGKWGLKLPVISLGLWQNFRGESDPEEARDIICHAFDSGVTHMDLANNYGPPPGSSEELFGKIFAENLRPYRDEMIISSKAGYLMWPGPYGEFGSRKYLIASCDQSLKRMGLDYVDIFYSHRPDPATPLEETMGALADIVKSGKALYAGISSYPADETRKAVGILTEMGVPCTIHQPSYSMINRWFEADNTIDVCDELGMGVIAFSPLTQGVLSGKYGKGTTSGTRATQEDSSMKNSHLTAEIISAVEQLRPIAEARGQSLVQLALSWVLRRKEITSALVGVRNMEQLKDNLGVLRNLKLHEDEILAIDKITQPVLMDLAPKPEGWLR